ncbi:MAG: hypothetical protein NT052_01835 [Candidatus Shapirobacteria bacterium]|nr:hypothetical protein [Candidatus Shapirobacteria bacterium]
MKIKVEEHQKKFLSTVEDDEDLKLYLIHHMHHFRIGSDMGHELHHCFLFSQKKMKGKKYSIVHKLYEDEAYHCLAEKFEGILYDHANNVFKIVPRKLGSRIIYEVEVQEKK